MSVVTLETKADLDGLQEGDVIEFYPDVNPNSEQCMTHALCGSQGGRRVFYQRGIDANSLIIYESCFDSRHVCPGPFGTLAFTGRHTAEVKQYTPDSPEYSDLTIKMSLAGLQ